MAAELENLRIIYSGTLCICLDIKRPSVVINLALIYFYGDVNFGSSHWRLLTATFSSCDGIFLFHVAFMSDV